MKKFIVAFVAIIALFSFTARAESGDKEYFVIKNGDNVTIYTINDRGENMYGNKDASIDVRDFVNPAVRDLRSYDVPEEAWKMCSMSENGAYSSKASKLNKALQEVKNDYENELKNTSDLKGYLFWDKVYITILFLIIVVLGGVSIDQYNKVKKLKQNQK